MTRTQKPRTCTICGKELSRSDSMKAHMMTHTNERPFKCSICGSFHRTKYDLDQHSRYVHGGEKRPSEKQVECIMCKKTMTNSNLNRHLLMHVREKPYSCSICDKDFADSSHLNSHLKSHEKLKGDPCLFCYKTFSIFSKPDDHIISHIKEKPYFCKTCPSSFSRRGSLRGHIRNVHFKEQRFLCEICKKAFYKRSDRDVHMSVHLNEKPYQCTACGKRHKWYSLFIRHMKTHNDVQIVFPCSKCKNVYKDKTSRTQHDKKKHQLTECIFCEKDITTDLISHLLKHTNERPFPCNSCEKDFRTLDHLKSHVRQIHSTERPFPCGICGKSFSTKSILQLHTNTHLNEKPFHCTVCSKRFKSFKGLKGHLEGHNDEPKPTFLCRKCNKTYTSQSNLTRHEKEKH